MNLFFYLSKISKENSYNTKSMECFSSRVSETQIPGNILNKTENDK